MTLHGHDAFWLYAAQLAPMLKTLNDLCSSRPMLPTSSNYCMPQGLYLIISIFWHYFADIHRVPKLATPLASNTLIIQFEVHGFQRNIAHCTTLTLLAVIPIMTYTPYRVCSVWPHWHQSSQTVWDELDQRINDKAIKQHLPRACVEAKGGHFEHKLKRLVQNDHLHECFTFCKNLSGINDFTPTCP